MVPPADEPTWPVARLRAARDIYHVLSCGCFGAEAKLYCDCQYCKQDTVSYWKDHIKMILLMFIHTDYGKCMKLWIFKKYIYLSFVCRVHYLIRKVFINNNNFLFLSCSFWCICCKLQQHLVEKTLKHFWYCC